MRFVFFIRRCPALPASEWSNICKMNKIVGIVGLGMLSIIVYFVDPLLSFSLQHLTSARICFLTAESKSAWTFVTCALSIFPVTPTVQASIPRESLGLEAMSSERYDRNEDLNNWKPAITLRWFAPFFSGGGYSSEAISYVSELQGMIDLSIVQHGDSYSDSFVRGLPAALRVRSTLIHSCFLRSAM
jgi:hypothetical protein